MIVCENCKIEVSCKKNGVKVVYGDSHVYAGDRYTCICGASFVVCNSSPHYESAVLETTDPENLVSMGGDR